MNLENLIMYKRTPNLKKKINKGFHKIKLCGAWSDEEEYDGEEMSNMCFMAFGESVDDESDNEKNANLSFMAIG